MIKLSRRWIKTKINNKYIYNVNTMLTMRLKIKIMIEYVYEIAYNI